MLSLNRGEWSELYSVLFLLVKPKIAISNDSLEIIENNIFVLESIIIDSKLPLKYSIVNDKILIYMNNIFFNSLTIQEIEKHREYLLNEILKCASSTGSFEIPLISEFLEYFSNGEILKGDSRNKSDMSLELMDNNIDRKVILNYSVKSSLGSPATILNASNHTNFKYKLSNLTKAQVLEINKISTRTKLLDRIRKIYEFNGHIKFYKVISETFKYNLDLVDSNLGSYLGNMLLYSYIENDKDIKSAFINSNEFTDKYLGVKKLEDFLESISFGMMPSRKWDGRNEIKGGLIIIKKDGEVVVLDLVYFSEYLRKYILNNTKLESPSSTRYNMLNIFEEDGEYYFTLNLQVRYKS